MLPVGLTCGEPAGIGPELAVAARAVRSKRPGLQIFRGILLACEVIVTVGGVGVEPPNVFMIAS